MIITGIFKKNLYAALLWHAFWLPLCIAHLGKNYMKKQPTPGMDYMYFYLGKIYGRQQSNCPAIDEAVYHSRKIYMKPF